MDSRMQAFLEGRERQLRMWRWVGPGTAVIVLFFFGWIYVLFPLYLDPFYLKQQIETHKLLPADIALLGVMGNIAFIACGLLILTLLLSTYLSLWNEQRLIRIIRELQQQDGDEGRGVEAEQPVMDDRG